MKQLEIALRRAGYVAFQRFKRQERAFKQCSCGAILDKNGVCRNCAPPRVSRKTILRKK